MKYSTQKIEYAELETCDIMTASGEGTLTVGNTTITGPESNFSAGYDELWG